jgi:hypothetical protein
MVRLIRWLVVLLLAATACAELSAPTVPPGATSSSIEGPTDSPTTAPPQLPVKVPKLVGLSLAEAKERLRARGLDWDIKRKVSKTKAPRTVLAQSPIPRWRVPRGTIVFLTVAKAPPEKPRYPPVNDNPWGYNWYCCNYITNPPSAFCSYFSCIGNFWNGRGYVIQCEDGMFSKSGGIQGSCSYHGGNYRALLDP